MHPKTPEYINTCTQTHFGTLSFSLLESITHHFWEGRVGVRVSMNGKFWVSKRVCECLQRRERERERTKLEDNVKKKKRTIKGWKGRLTFSRLDPGHPYLWVLIELKHPPGPRTPSLPLLDTYNPETELSFGPSFQIGISRLQVLYLIATVWLSTGKLIPSRIFS